MSARRIFLSDKALWQRVVTDRPDVPLAASAQAVSDMDLAAWLEGSLPEAEKARVEAALVVDPALRRAAFELADILDKPLPAAPARLVRRAERLVGSGRTRAIGGGWFAALWVVSSGGTGFQRSAMAAAAVVVAVAGFMLGDGIGWEYQQSVYAWSQPAAQTAGSPLTRSLGVDPIDELSDLFSDAT
jgi:hypothetical protein